MPGPNMNLAVKIYEKCFPMYFVKLISTLEKHKEILKQNVADFEWNRLLWMYIHLLTDINLCKFKREVCKIVMYHDIPDRPNGGKWIALGFENSFPFECRNDWKEYIPYDGPVHKGDNDKAQNFFHYWSGLDSSEFFDIPSGVFELCHRIILGEVRISELSAEQKLLFSAAVEKNLFIKSDDSFKPNYCFISKVQMEQIQIIADEFYDEAITYFESAWDIVLNEYEKLVPKHLRWQMGNLLSNHLNGFVTASLFEAVNENILSIPVEKDKPWLSLFATE
jgi:hypothetical protein